jgi:hypothetical protein
LPVISLWRAGEWSSVKLSRRHYTMGEKRAGAEAFQYNVRFLEFIELFSLIGADSRIFPKTCRTCGRVYGSFPDYLHKTSAAAHGLEEYAISLDPNFTMQYRNCACGTTLTIAFTKATYPLLDKFWEMMGNEAKRTGKPLREIVVEFRDQCNRYIRDQAEPEGSDE